MRILCVYRPPDESAYALFYEEFSRLLEHILARWSGDLLIVGDFNFHLDDLNNRHAKRFVDGFGLQQHVKGPTHKKGHTLDLIITRSVVGLENGNGKSKTQSDRERYVHQCYVVNNLICNLKTTYYREIISENSGNQKVFFNTVNKLLQKSCVKRYPPSSDACSLANAFADFFAQKIDRIHADLHEKQRTADPNVSSSESTRCQVELSDFAVLSQDTVKEYASKSAKKSCNLDPSLMKNCLDMLLPTITNIVNLSLSTGTMPETLKVAELVPALKKHDADHEQFSNFRPISNLVMV